MSTRNTAVRNVVLLHGLGRSRASMLPLQWSLRRAGFRVERIGYPSTRMQMAEAVTYLAQQLPPTTDSIVGHSLGGVLAVRLMHHPKGGGIRRVVQLGSPNLGSAVATEAGQFWPFRTLCGPALRELAPHSNALPPDPRVGAIAGTSGQSVVETGLGTPNDGAVDRASAWAGAGHCAEVPVLHTLLPVSPKVAELTRTFLTSGHF